MINILMRSIFIVLSIIQCKNIPLSYSNIRSIYSTEQRFKQTIETISSIKKHAPGADILLIESSETLTDEHIKYFTDNADYFIHDPSCQVHTIYKAKGEASQMICALSNIKSLPRYDHYFKISGRYCLTDDFDYKLLTSTDYCVVKPIQGSSTGITTSLYKLNKEQINKFELFLRKFSEYDKFMYEEMFYLFLKGVTCMIPAKIGVSGKVSIDGTEIQY